MGCAQAVVLKYNVGWGWAHKVKARWAVVLVLRVPRMSETFDEVLVMTQRVCISKMYDSC